MSENSTIGWTDATWPIVAGCEYESPGCSNCWAVRDSWRLAHNPNPKVHNAYFGTVDKLESGKLAWSGIVRMLYDRLGWPLKWRGSKRVFVCSQADLFNPKVRFDFIAAAFGVMAMCPEHTFQVLTKHARRMREFFEWLDQQQNGALETCLWHARQALGAERSNRHEPFPDKLPAWPLENVWAGVTVEDQARAEQRIPELLRCPAAVRWVSYEPALELVDFEEWLWPICTATLEEHLREHDAGMWCVEASLDWIVIGGESAQTRANTREFSIEWARAVIAQCRKAGTKVFMKQLGTKPIGSHQIDVPLPPLPKGKTSRYKWHEPEHWPEDLRVQEFPA